MNKERLEKFINETLNAPNFSNGYDRDSWEKDKQELIRDIEVLEIIKERFVWLENGKLYCGRINDIEIPIDEDSEGNEEMELLREWLKRWKINKINKYL